MGDARVLQGRYQLGELLGEGGMGVVHRGVDLRLERPVAIKLVHPDVEAGGARTERFLKEAKRTAQLRHPGIVEVYDYGQTDDGEAFFVMELLEGESLARRIARQGKLSAAAAVHVATQICAALAAAHDAGLVHRDLKPANVLLVRAGEDDARVKVVDFGVAKRVGGATQLTEAGMLVGTVDYMAPEQIRGDAVDGRADVYAMGALLTVMLTGVPPFDADNVATIVHQHLSVTPRSVREREPTISPALEAVVKRCLLKDPASRFASMRELEAALVAARDGKAPAPPPKRAPLPARAPAAEREVELDDAPLAMPLELEDVERPLARPLAASPASDLAVAATSAGRPRLAPWIERMAVLPVAVSKRLVGYALVALVLERIFFRPSAVVTVATVAVAAVGAAFLWARHRVERGAGG
jgi:eukaryotic-like serine/threonine-protein kinase